MGPVGADFAGGKGVPVRRQSAGAHSLDHPARTGTDRGLPAAGGGGYTASAVDGGGRGRGRGHSRSGVERGSAVVQGSEMHEARAW